ncbi:hypothetical protein HGRIS_009053 [Hohenbuehelia grisea]|uniref:Uncharacterized protein n=1 Tax=Hohenbuehelia grisea TaxID=104357 RepID=A0ABR3J028_9AGAR
MAVPHAAELAQASIAFAVTNTIMCTCLFSGRLWYMQRRISKLMGTHGLTKAGRSYHGIALVFIESGALYTIAIILSVVLREAKNEGLPIVMNMTIPIIGILPTLIIVFAHLNMIPGTRTQEDYAATLPDLHANDLRSISPRSAITQNTGSRGISCLDVAVRE